MRHGDHSQRDIEDAERVYFFGDDPELALVVVDMHSWALAHPCNCEALCVCDADE